MTLLWQEQITEAETAKTATAMLTENEVDCNRDYWKLQDKHSAKAHQVQTAEMKAMSYRMAGMM